MTFIVRNIDGFRVAWAARKSNWKINVDDVPTLTVWLHNIFGKKLIVHFLDPADAAPIGDHRNLVGMLKGPVPASILVGEAVKSAIERGIDETGRIVPRYYEQEYVLVNRLRK